MIHQFLHKVFLPALLLLLLAATENVSAQITRPPMGNPGAPVPGAMMPGSAGPGTAAPGAVGDKVDLIHADSLNVLNQPGAVVYRLINNVKLQQKGVVLYCDLAIQNKTTNVIEAYGNVRMVQGDTINVRGDTLYYYGNTRQANVLGHVVLKDRKMTLNTARLDYDMLSGVAHYPVKGRIVDRENILTSDEGYYDTRTKQFIFQRNVRLLNQPPGKEKTTILADSLLYNSLSKIADFQGPTRIISKDGTLVARNGQYNTTTRISNFRQRATAETDKYTLTGDTLNFDNVNEVGVAHGNVVIINKEDKTTLTGDHGRYNGKAGVSRMIGHAIVRSPISQGTDRDTLFMRADTLFSFDNKLTKRKKIIGQKNVLVYKSDLQSKCDSLVYDVSDSLLYFYKKPIVWSQNYQMEADSMTARLKNNRINVLYLKTRSFVISQDTLRNFNQVKGRQITAYFRTILAPLQKTGKPANNMTASSVNRPALTPVVPTTAVAEKTTLDRVLVEGNGQTIYFAVDEKNRLVGMNRTECSKMNIEFTDSRVTRIRNYGRPDMFLTPPKELTDEKKQLDGFRWREKEKPTRAQTLGLTPLDEPKPTTPQNTVATVLDKLGPNAGATVKSAIAPAVVKSALTKSTLVATAKSVASTLTAPVAGTTAISRAGIASGVANLSVANKPVLPKTRPIVSKPIAGTATGVVTFKPASATATGAVVARAAPVRAAEPTVTAPVAPAVIEKLTRTVLPDKLMARLLPKPVTLLPVARPAQPIEPVIAQPVVVSNSTAGQSGGLAEPVADSSATSAAPLPVAAESESVPALQRPAELMSTESVASPNTIKGEEAATPDMTESAKKAGLSTKPAPSAKPAVSSSSSSTLPTRRAEKQQKANTQWGPKTKPKADPTPPTSEQSDLERELNRKPKK